MTKLTLPFDTAGRPLFSIDPVHIQTLREQRGARQRSPAPQVTGNPRRSRSPAAPPFGPSVLRRARLHLLRPAPKQVAIQPAAPASVPGPICSNPTGAGLPAHRRRSPHLLSAAMAAGEGDEGEGRSTDWPSPSLVVRSPRQTVSLLRNRRRHRDPFPRSPSFAAGDHGPKPSEVYGFVGSITTVIATAVYLAWAYTPEPWLRSVGITYYPSKYWALAVPSFVIVAVVLSMVIYMGFNFLATPPPTSINTIFDENSRERVVFPSAMNEEEGPIKPISDMSIDRINNLMFGDR